MRCDSYFLAHLSKETALTTAIDAVVGNAHPTKKLSHGIFINKKNYNASRSPIYRFF